MRIVDPTFGVPADQDAVAVERAAAAAGLCLFSNSKPGANELLDGVGRRLAAERGVSDIGFAAKPNAAAAAETATLDHLAAQYRTAVVAIGD